MYWMDYGLIDWLIDAGQRPHDIEQAWQELEKQEYLREVALKEELLRQERLEQLAYKFERKSVLREGYLNEMIQVKVLGSRQDLCFR